MRRDIACFCRKLRRLIDLHERHPDPSGGAADVEAHEDIFVDIGAVFFVAQEPHFIQMKIRLAALVVADESVFGLREKFYDPAVPKFVLGRFLGHQMYLRQ